MILVRLVDRVRRVRSSSKGKTKNCYLCLTAGLVSRVRRVSSLFEKKKKSLLCDMIVRLVSRLRSMRSPWTRNDIRIIMNFFQVSEQSEKGKTS